MIEKHDNFCHLLSIHNVNFLFTLMRRLRKAIETESLSEFLRYLHFHIQKIPERPLQSRKKDTRLGKLCAKAS